ncbi:hypothetical protein [Chachezhania sediminis]|uniref:hypothetical protein n=1 Tax=Chachezhania sediminis TaxID=2599291 RepID=UPI00131DC0C3|nr:hypothetical protein [Chachezhania sediminis]
MRLFNRIAKAGAVALLTLPIATASGADDFTGILTELGNTAIRDLANDPQVISAVQTQNLTTYGYDQSQIDALDTKWANQTAINGPMVAETLGNPLSQHLLAVVEDNRGLFAEVFVTDHLGLNVGQSHVTSDYWQGDEPKWDVPMHTDDIHIGEINFDDSSQSYVAHVSHPIHDPDTGSLIGVIVVGVNVEVLADLQ